MNYEKRESEVLGQLRTELLSKPDAQYAVTIMLYTDDRKPMGEWSVNKSKLERFAEEHAMIVGFNMVLIPLVVSITTGKNLMQLSHEDYVESIIREKLTIRGVLQDLPNSSLK